MTDNSEKDHCKKDCTNCTVHKKIVGHNVIILSRLEI